MLEQAIDLKKMKNITLHARRWFALSAIISVSAQATVSNDEINEAVAQMRAGNPLVAHSILLKSHEESSINPQEWFLLGISAKQSKRMGDAKRYLSHALALAPDADRIKLELAEVSIALGEAATARQLLLEVKAGNPPARVLATIDRYLLAVSQSTAQKKNWQLTGTLGWMHDSNANGGPNTATVELFGLPFVLSRDARKQGDQAYTTQMDFSHLFELNDTLALQSSLGLAWTDYQSVDSQDALYFSASSGVLLKQNERMIWSLPVLFDWLRLGQQDSYYYYSYGIAPQLRYRYSPQWAGTMGVSALRKNYQNDTRDSDMLGVQVFLDYRIDEHNSFRFSLNHANESAARDYYSHARSGVGISYYHGFSKDILLAVSGGYSTTRYDQAEAAFGKKRHDETFRYSASLNYRIAPLEADLIVALNYTDNRSSVKLYEYDRLQSSVSLRKTF